MSRSSVPKPDLRRDKKVQLHRVARKSSTPEVAPDCFVVKYVCKVCASLKSGFCLTFHGGHGLNTSVLHTPASRYKLAVVRSVSQQNCAKDLGPVTSCNFEGAGVVDSPSMC